MHSRNAGRTNGLVDRIEDLVLKGISDGSYPLGEPLPSRSELAERLGVGERTVRAAIARLAASGVLEVRRRVGAIVLKRDVQRRKGIFLDVRSEDFGSCAGARFSLGVRRTVCKAGYQYREVQLPFTDPGGVDVSILRAELGEKADFVLIRAPNCRLRKVAGVVASVGVPYATVSNRIFAKGTCVGNIRYDSKPSIAELVEDCKRAGIRSVLQFDLGDDSYLDARTELEAVGISVERLWTPHGSNYENLDKLVLDSFLVMKQRLAAGPLPDLLLVFDDFLANGAIPALYQSGLRIPEDIRVVAYANKGAGFPFLHTMACLEADPFREGVNCARLALRYLGGKPFEPYVIRAIYCRGSSFPIR